jgi:UDPglucose 6-dehydrogenase
VTAERGSRAIAVIGDWHQAAVNAAELARLGHAVTGIVGKDVLPGFQSGRAPLREPGLDELLAEQMQSDRLRYTASYEEGLAGAEFAYVAIDTPVNADDTSDLAPIEAAFEQLARAASADLVVCLTAQVPVGTTNRIAAGLATARPDLEFSVAYVPEFLRLGTALESFRDADRFVIGSDDPKLADRIAELYRPTGRPLVFTGIRSAEMAKHASNAFLATSISFINQIADLCEGAGADIAEVASVMRLDRRIGPHAFLSPGLGYAGGTLGRDVMTLEAMGHASAKATPLLAAVTEVNRARVPLLVERIRGAIGGDLSGHRVGVLGLTYKAGTSTLRRSAALELIDRLSGEGAIVLGFDPLADPSEIAESATLELVRDPVQAAEGSDALVLVSPWPGIEGFDLAAVAATMRRPNLFDPANVLSPSAMAAAGFRYHGSGRS